MIDHNKITPAHLRRAAIVYIRQSTAAQVESHRESTARQYALAERALELGWKPDLVTVIDQDLGGCPRIESPRSCIADPRCKNRRA